MADYSDITAIQRFTFTLREAQFAKPDERGQWKRANCTRCGEKIPIGHNERATELLHRLYEHACSPASGRGTVSR